MSEILGSHPSFAQSWVESITAAKTLTEKDNGKVFVLDSTGGAYEITLDSACLTAGWGCKFIVGENTPTGAITIGAGSAIVYGNLEQQSDTNEDNRVACAGVSNVIIGTSALKGDYLNYISDGTYYYVSGMSSIQTAVSTS